MAQARFTSFYAGHGGLYYTEVKDNAGTTILHLVVDAGTKPRIYDAAQLDRNLDSIAVNVKDFPADVVVCLTHPHLDHYSHIDDLLVKIGQLVTVGLKVFLTMDPGDFNVMSNPYACQKAVSEMCKPLNSMTRHNQVFRNLMKHFPNSLYFLASYHAGVECLWHSTTLDAKLYRLFTWLDDSIEKNRNGTLFALKLDRSLIWFTGDITGENMRWVIEEDAADQVRKDIASLTDQTDNVAITVPHHGSVHSLEQGCFIYADPTKGEDSPFTVESLGKFLALLTGGNFSSAFVSADFMDEYGHPDAWTLYWLTTYLKPCAGQHDFIGYKHVEGYYAIIADANAHTPLGYYWDTFSEYKDMNVTWNMSNPADAATVFCLNPSFEILPPTGGA